MTEAGGSARRSPTAEFLGADAERGGPFSLLGLSPTVEREEEILAARERQMRRVDAHRLAETPEADEVRLSLYAAAAQLLNPMIRAQLAVRWGAVEARSPEPSPLPEIGRPAGGRTATLEHDAILALAMHGGWNRKALRHIASIAHARGLTSQDVAQTLRRIGRQRRPRARGAPVARIPAPARRSVVAPKAPAPAAPTSILDPLPEQIDPAQQMLKTGLIVAGVAVVSFLVLFGGVFALMRADRAAVERRAAGDRGEAPVAPGTPAAPVLGGAPAGRTIAREMPTAQTLGDPGLIVHEIEGARRGLEFSPYDSTRRFADAVELLSASWVGFDAEELERANTAVLGFVETLTSRDAARLAIEDVGAGPLRLADTEREPTPEGVWPSVWSVGMLSQLRQSPVLDARVRRQIEVLLGGASIDTSGGAFRHGAVLGLGAVADRLASAGSGERVWGHWIETVDAISKGDSALRVSLLTAALDRFLSGVHGEDAVRGEVIRELALAMSWRRSEGARRWLVRVLRRERVHGPTLSTMIEALTRASGASGLDATVELAPGATRRERELVAERLVGVWGLDQDARADAFVQDMRSLVETGLRERSTSGDPVERMVGAVRLAYANAAAELAHQRRFEEASAALDRGGAYALPRASRTELDPLGAENDTHWAVRYRNAGSSTDERLAELDRLGKQMTSQIGPADAEVLLAEALRGTPRAVRERAQSVTAKFVSSPAMINAMLEQVDSLPGSEHVMNLVQLMTASPVDRGAPDGSWRVAARRALLASLTEAIAREGPTGRVDAMRAELEHAYSMALGYSDSEGHEGAGMTLGEAARARAAFLRREARRTGVSTGLPIRTDEIEADLRSREAIAQTPIQRFVACQTALCESLALLMLSERRELAPEIERLLDDLRGQLREATHVLDQVGVVELTMARLWLLFEGGDG
ncbi:MAG: hypothetical protein ACIARR_05785 [Phycisphaerales bacterium JB059]